MTLVQKSFKCERLLETWHFEELDIIRNHLWHSEQSFVGELLSGGGIICYYFSIIC